MAESIIKIPFEVAVISDVLDNITVNAQTNSANIDLPITRSGYTFLGVVGYSIAAATNGGSNASACTLYRIVQNSTNVRAALHNWSSSVAKVKVDVQLLYVKNN